MCLGACRLKAIKFENTVLGLVQASNSLHHTPNVDALARTPDESCAQDSNKGEPKESQAHEGVTAIDLRHCEYSAKVDVNRDHFFSEPKGCATVWECVALWP
jgi:hypothetical protein